MTKNRETPFFILRESLLRQNVEAFFTALRVWWDSLKRILKERQENA